MLQMEEGLAHGRLLADNYDIGNVIPDTSVYTFDHSCSHGKDRQTIGITGNVLRRAKPHRQHRSEEPPPKGPSLARRMSIGRHLTNHKNQEASIWRRPTTRLLRRLGYQYPVGLDHQSNRKALDNHRTRRASSGQDRTFTHLPEGQAVQLVPRSYR